MKVWPPGTAVVTVYGGIGKTMCRIKKYKEKINKMVCLFYVVLMELWKRLRYDNIWYRFWYKKNTKGEVP